MNHHQYDEPSSSSAPPPPYSVSAPGSGSFTGSFTGSFDGSVSSSLHPPAPTSSHGASGLTPEKASHNSPYGGVLDSKRHMADPRSSSAQSLAPSINDRDNDARRTLLIIYVHGFYGNESSFRSFPAHVHNYLKDALAETHAVHSKIYPRYKTYKAIDVARDNFSQWLEPHESDKTDVVLVGHSMGGILAGEVALMPNRHPYRRQPFKHRILGTISLDSPFLGLHPGIVVAGIASLFRPASPTEEAHDQLDASAAHLSPGNSAFNSPNPSMSNLESTPSLGEQLSPQPSVAPSIASSNDAPPNTDPWFNPPFWNDSKFKDRSFMKRLGHFAKKHRAEGVWDATKNHVMSHLEYGGCLADYPGLNARYNKLRALEDVDPLQHLKGNNQGSNPNQSASARVRFVNYYTLSSGRPKKPKSPKSPESPRSPDQDLPTGPMSTLDINSQLSPHGSSTPRISVEGSDNEEVEILSSIEAVDRKLSTLHEERQAESDNAKKAQISGTLEQQSDTKGKGKEPKGKEKEVLDHEEATDGPSEDKGKEDKPASEEETTPESAPSPDTPADMELPPIPDLPEQPTPPDLDKYTDKDARKQAEKEGKRAQKAYEQAVKSRDKAIKERQKLVEKRRKKAEKEALKEAQQLEKEQKKKRQEEEADQKKTREELQRDVEAAQRRAEAAQRELEAAQRQAEAVQRDTDAAQRQQPAHKPKPVGKPAEPEADEYEEPEEDTGPLTQVEPRPISQDGPPAPAPAPAAPPQPKSAPPLPPRMPSTSASSLATGPASSAASIATAQTGTPGTKAPPAGPQKPKKERKFCTLPRKANGRRDEAWVPIYMEGMDEVGAHCGLFVPGPHYDRLIGDVGERILGWVQDDMTARAILEMS